MSTLEWTEETMAQMAAKAVARPRLGSPTSRAIPPGEQFDPARELARVAKHYGLTPEDLTGRRREARVMRARKALYRSLHEHGWSSVDIGAFVGGRDHSTVLSALHSMGMKRGGG